MDKVNQFNLMYQVNQFNLMDQVNQFKLKDQVNQFNLMDQANQVNHLRYALDITTSKSPFHHSQLCSCLPYSFMWPHPPLHVPDPPAEWGPLNNVHSKRADLRDGRDSWFTFLGFFLGGLINLFYLFNFTFILK